MTRSEVLVRFNRLASRWSLPLEIDFTGGKARIGIKLSSNGRYELGLESTDTITRYLSPRLTTSQLDLWLDGFEEGLECGKLIPTERSVPT